jgi:hypothetical protein
MSTTHRRPAVLAAVFGLSLALSPVATLAAGPAHAAAVPANSAKEMAQTLTSAFVTTTDLGITLRNMSGKPASADVQRGLAVVDHLMATVERLGNGHPSLAPGISHVRTNTAGVVVGGKVSDKAATLLDENLAELHALIVNAYILQAMAELGSAADALDKKSPTEVTFYLQNAEQALQRANDRGAYHIEHDIEDIQAALLDVQAKVAAKVPVTRDALETRISELQTHLFQLGGE